MKRLVIISDLHCGHRAGLTPPGWQYQDNQDDKERNTFGRQQRDIWNFYAETIDRLKPIDILVCNGDAIDGKGERSGGTEQLESDRAKQVEIAAQCIDYADAKAKVIIYGCLTSGHKILTSDLTWVNVETLNPGDTLLAFEENANGNNKRKFIKSHVVCNNPITKNTYKLIFRDGSHITASHDHAFLMRRGGRKLSWVTAEHIYKISHPTTNGFGNSNGLSQYMPMPFPRPLPVWGIDHSYEAGYIAGFFDGEGTINQSHKNRKRSKDGRNFISEEHSFAVSAVQKNNVVLKQIEQYLTSKGFKVSNLYHDKRADTHIITVTGGWRQKLKLLGSMRPVRLMENFNIDKLGCIRSNSTHEDDELELVDVVPAGEQIVYGLSTTSKTYISDGFFSHNTPYHTGKEEDFEQILGTKVNAGKVGGHEWLDINGLIFDFKHFISSSIIPHGRYTSIARDALWNKIWSMDEMQPNAAIIIRSHVHYHRYAGEPGSLMMTTPALQGFGSKFGVRMCSGKVDIGLVYFDVDDNGGYEWKAELLKADFLKVRPLSISHLISPPRNSKELAAMT